MKPDTMFYIALGAVIGLVEKANFWTGCVDLAETTEQANLYARRALKYKTKAIVEFDREMDRLVKE